MTGQTAESETDDENGYRYEPSIAEQAIRTVVREGVADDYGEREIEQAVTELLRDDRVAAPTVRQLDNQRAARQMSAEFGDRLRRAAKRLRNAAEEYRGETGIEFVHPGDDEWGACGNDGRAVAELLPGDETAETVAVARKVDYRHSGEVRIESEYPLVRVGDHAVCTCPDRHYNRRDGGTCYHELAFDMETAHAEGGDGGVVRV